MATLDERGREILDQTPVAIPVPFTKPESIEARLQRMVYAASVQAAANGDETIEEANDFEMDEDPSSFESVHEEHYDEISQRVTTPFEEHSLRQAALRKDFEDFTALGLASGLSGDTLREAFTEFLEARKAGPAEPEPAEPEK